MFFQHVNKEGLQMPQVKSYDDCLNRSNLTGLSPRVIAEAHGISIPKSPEHKKVEKVLTKTPRPKVQDGSSGNNNTF